MHSWGWGDVTKQGQGVLEGVLAAFLHRQGQHSWCSGCCLHSSMPCGQGKGSRVTAATLYSRFRRALSEQTATTGCPLACAAGSGAAGRVSAGTACVCGVGFGMYRFWCVQQARPWIRAPTPARRPLCGGLLCRVCPHCSASVWPVSLQSHGPLLLQSSACHACAVAACCQRRQLQPHAAVTCIADGVAA